MDTKEKNRARKRPVSASRPASGRAPAKKGSPKRGGTDRSRREAAARAAKIKAMKQQVQTAPKRRVSKPKRPMQPIVYTQPKVFNRTRLLVQLLSVAAVVLAAVLCLSIFFRVEHVYVSGANAYSAWEVREASGIQEGDYLLTFSRARASAKIKAGLPYVESVRIGIKLPNTVNIVIEEIDVLYAIQDQNDQWWLITSSGTVMQQTDTAGIVSYTKVQGVKLREPEVGQSAQAFQELIVQNPTQESQDPTQDETQAQTPLLVTQQQKLNAALDILVSLELNELVGTVASVDVSDLTRIELWYQDRFHVNLGDTGRMDYKIACLKSSVNKLGGYDSGELDISFTTWPDKVAYTPG